jgi:hypothetical protein
MIKEKENRLLEKLKQRGLVSYGGIATLAELLYNRRLCENIMR